MVRFLQIKNPTVLAGAVNNIYQEFSGRCGSEKKMVKFRIAYTLRFGAFV